MFNFFSKKKTSTMPVQPPLADLTSSSKSNKPPSTNQIEICSRLGLEVSAMKNYDDVKKYIEISLKEEKYKLLYDEIQRERESKLEAEDRATYGTELYEEYRKWEKYRESSVHYLLVYKRSSNLYADVVEIDGVELVGDGKYKLKIEILLPKLHKDKHTDDWIEWEKELTLTPGQILRLEPLPMPIDMFDLEGYRSAKTKCDELAKEFVV